MPVTPQPAIEPQDIGLLGSDFPPGLNTATPATDLEPNETPDGYGYDLTKDGVIAKAAIPSASSRTLKTFTITEGALSVPYFWVYQRLWNITNRTAATGSTTLIYGAKNYQDIYVPQGLGKWFFNDAANNILAIQPFGRDNMFIATAGGGYVLSGLTDTRAFWGRTHLIEEIECGGATGCLELNGVVYCASVNGLYAYNQNGQVEEITRKVRNDLTNFGNVALTVDYEKGYVKGGTRYIYEPATRKLFDYNSTNFRWTSRRFHMRDWRPFTVDAVWFTVNHTNTSDGWFKWQLRIEDDEAWSDEETTVVAFENEQFTTFRLMMEDNRSCHKWQIRLTDLASNLQIKEVRLESEDFQPTSYSQ